MRSSTPMAVQRAAVQSTGCSMRSYTLMVVQRAAVQHTAVQCVAILQWLFNAQLFNSQLGWVCSSILKYQVDNRCNFTDRMEKVGQIEIEKLLTKMT